MSILATTLLAALGCAPIEAPVQPLSAPPAPPTIPPAFTIDLPAPLLPHCLYGLDPHDEAVRPHPRGPAAQGYRISPGNRLHLLRYLGFERGDLLRSVNGAPLGTAERYYAARQAIEGHTTCSWLLLREGQQLHLQANIVQQEAPPLVLERDARGTATAVSRQTLWQRLSDPYALGRYSSVLAMRFEDGVYVVDSGLQALMAELGFDPLDHHQLIDDQPLLSSLDLLLGLESMLSRDRVRWQIQRDGEELTVELEIRGGAIPLPAVEQLGAQRPAP